MKPAPRFRKGKKARKKETRTPKQTKLALRYAVSCFRYSIYKAEQIRQAMAIAGSAVAAALGAMQIAVINSTPIRKDGHRRRSAPGKGHRDRTCIDCHGCRNSGSLQQLAAIQCRSGAVLPDHLHTYKATTLHRPPTMKTAATILFIIFALTGCARKAHPTKYGHDINEAKSQ